PDAVAGDRCAGRAGLPSRPDARADTMSDGEVGGFGQPSLPADDPVEASCRYGQALGEAQGHYEETNSVGWDAAQDMFDAVVRLTGTRDTSAVNPHLAGYWHLLPPD